jgi:hypothetical protein
MPLPDSWVDKLFRKLSATYGQAFLRQYDGVPMEDVKANWGQELACFQQNPNAIGRGLELLPADRAPTVLQFRELCKSTAQSEHLALPAPTAAPVSPEVVAATKAAFKRSTAVGNKDWAYALKEREARGPGLTKFQRGAWRDALREVPQGELLQ